MDQKERIIEQAMHMFVSQGIKSVRMDDIAQQLGVSKRTLYELFGDKEGLLYLAMDRYFEKKRIERAAVCGGVDSERQPADDRQPGAGEGVGEGLGVGYALLGGVAAADDGERWAVQQIDATDRKEYRRRVGRGQ